MEYKILGCLTGLFREWLVTFLSGVPIEFVCDKSAGKVTNGNNVTMRCCYCFVIYLPSTQITWPRGSALARTLRSGHKLYSFSAVITWNIHWTNVHTLRIICMWMEWCSKKNWVNNQNLQLFKILTKKYDIAGYTARTSLCMHIIGNFPEISNVCR